MLIFDQSSRGRSAGAQYETTDEELENLPEGLRRDSGIGLPAVSELQVVRHYTNL